MKNFNRMSRIGLVTLALGGSALATSYSIAFAAPKQPAMTKKVIELNGKTVSNPMGFVQNQTTYMPVWYVMSVLNKLGIKSTWNGKTWNVQTSTKPSFTLQGKTGNMDIVVEGTTFDSHVESEAYNDPYSGKPTTFVPIWYIQEVLQSIGVTNNWDGQTWSMTSKAASSTTASGSSTSSSSTGGESSTPSSSTGGGSSTSTGTGLTQQDFVNAMFKVFSGVGTMNGANGGGYTAQSVGIQATSDSITAGQASQFIYDWAHQARSIGVDNPGTEYSGLGSAYGWAATEGTLFQGTSVSGASSTITTSELPTIMSNLKTWLDGGYLSGNTLHTHFPMVPIYGIWQSDSGTHVFSSFQSELPEIIENMKMVDSATLSVANGEMTYNQTIPEGTITLAPDISSDISSNAFGTSKGYDSPGSGFSDHFPINVKLVPNANEVYLAFGSTDHNFAQDGVSGLANYEYDMALANGKIVFNGAGGSLTSNINTDYKGFVQGSFLA